MIKRVIKTAKIYGWPSKTFSCKNNAEYARHTLNETASGKCRDSVVMDRHAKKNKKQATNHWTGRSTFKKTDT